MKTLTKISFSTTLFLLINITPCAYTQVLESISTKGGVEMVLLNGGTFVMGKTTGESETSAHTVYVSPFFIDVTPVTQTEYMRLMKKNRAKFIHPQQPVEQVRWSDAVRYCNARSRDEGLVEAYNIATWNCNYEADGYRLPTEAEWEYAARAGTTTDYFFGNDSKTLHIYSWYIENAGDRPRPVRSKRPNPWGIYDIIGNVWEWCNDFYQEDYYEISPTQNPRGPNHGEEKVLRGGCWNSSAAACCVTYRYSDNPGYTDACMGYDIYGFRAVRPYKN